MSLTNCVSSVSHLPTRKRTERQKGETGGRGRRRDKEEETYRGKKSIKTRKGGWGRGLIDMSLLETQKTRGKRNVEGSD